MSNRPDPKWRIADCLVLLEAGDGEGFLEKLNEGAHTDPQFQTPSPYARAFCDDEGAWETSKESVDVVFVDKDKACCGKLSSLNLIGQVHERFCPLDKAECKTASHVSWKIAEDLRKTGFYPRGGNARGGVIADCCFQLVADGGSITPRAAAYLASPKTRLKMPLGKWRFFLAELQAAKVESLKSSPSSTLSVETTLPVETILEDSDEEDDDDRKLPALKHPVEKSGGSLQAALETLTSPSLTVKMEEVPTRAAIAPGATSNDLEGVGELLPFRSAARRAAFETSMETEFNAAKEDPTVQGLIAEMKSASVPEKEEAFANILLHTTALVQVLLKGSRTLVDLQENTKDLRGDVLDASAQAVKAHAECMRLAEECERLAEAAGTQAGKSELAAISAAHDSEQATEKLNMIKKVNDQVKLHLRAVQQIESHRQDETGSLPDDWRTRIEDLEFDVRDSQGRVERIRTSVNKLRQNVESDGGFECHGVSFGSADEFSAWFEEKGGDIGMYHDFVSLLQSIQSAVVHPSEASREREAQKKINIETHMEAAVVTSFDTKIPSVLVGNKKGVSGSGLEAMKSAMKMVQDFEPSGRHRGIAHQILEGIKLMEGKVEKLIAQKAPCPEAAKLASNMLQDAVSFARRWVNWMVTYHRQLTHDTAYGSDDVWEMMLECTEQILDELHYARASYADAARYDPAMYVYGLAKSGLIMNRYEENNFGDDSGITGIMVRRLLMHSQDVALKDRLDSIEEKNERTEQHYATIAGEVKNMKRDLKDVVAKIKKAEDKGVFN